MRTRGTGPTLSEWTGPPGPDEVIGTIHEAAPTEDVAVVDARVEISGGDQNGRFVTSDTAGAFRFDHIQTAGFDLFVSKTGYRSARFRVVQLPRWQGWAKAAKEKLDEMMGAA